jgi:hypothetical protein
MEAKQTQQKATDEDGQQPHSEPLAHLTKHVPTQEKVSGWNIPQLN